ncbi:F/Y-rich N-terminus family protein [Tritrichomonas foetus]|uniref:F/Y-rich N-terminus family protein n=1 Tax=Tritrichomonas foetus TaxID=1144522 RepID=A0A1J4L1V3_9EUKA|nr:F/Y-rich N-terminus family protein [Tritrichomonas foetus]|eukprot:OHT17419.1 F/Y-rich N-terminus family protein [Tritrichomonas foetus]
MGRTRKIEQNNNPNEQNLSSSRSNENTSVPISKSVSEEQLRTSTSEEEPEMQTGTPQLILAHKEEGNNKKFLVKFHKRSYYDVEWLFSHELIALLPNLSLIRNYEKHHLKPPPQPYFKKSYLIPEKIITSQVFEGGVTKYLTKWTDLDYDEATWEKEDRFHEYQNILNSYIEIATPPAEKICLIPPHPDVKSFTMIKKNEFPKSRLGHEIRPYQIDGVNFLMNSWFKQRNAILADEMGLGKTLQSLMFLHHLSNRQKVWGPFLIVAPLSTIPNWEREATEWTNLRHLSFYGSRIRRILMSQYELFYNGTMIPKFQILFTTYEYALKECERFSKIDWQVIVVDEAHRLKNNESKLFASLMKLHPKFKVLLTGTPLQNNTNELWSLLHYLNNEEFKSADEFNEKFGNLSEADQITDLQNILKPLMLRRLKGDVEKSIAPFEEIIIECSMTQHQKAYYTSFYQKNMEYLTRGAHTTNHVNLHNICMELRKCCNHPYLIADAENQILVERKEALNLKSTDRNFVIDSLIKSSGKMIFLDKLLAKLKDDGHRVLIFSQMVHMLDIIQDYLTYKDYTFQRLDGKIRGEERQKNIDHFNDPNSDDFIFLLCTKAGGVGINLTSADTVIIYDSDWNPQNDIQATARCHRIGQTKEVKVYRFITANSYERTLFDSASHKLGLDSAVLGSHSSIKKQTEHIEKMLKLGAYYAFQEDKTDEKISEEDIDSILKRSQRIKHNHIAAGSEGSTFSKLQFEVESDKNLDLTAKDFWQRYIPKDKDKPRRPIVVRTERTKQRKNLREESDDDTAVWGKAELSRLTTTLLRFGYGRWQLIYDHVELDVTLTEIRSVSRIILKLLLQSSEDEFPVIKSAYLKPSNKTDRDFETSFIKHHSSELEEVAKSGATWKLSRLESIFFLNAAISQCPNPPKGLLIPDISAQKPAKWWTEDDDKKLLYNVWQNGFMEYNGIEFTQKTPVTTTQLTLRVKALITSIKQLFTRYKEMSGKDIEYNFKTFSDAMDAWTVREQRSTLSAISSLGIKNLNSVYEQTGITRKSFKKFRSFVNQLIDMCNEIYDGHHPSHDGLPEKITHLLAEKVVSRIDVLEKLEKINDLRRYKDKEKAIIEYVKSNGFMNLSRCKEIVNTFGSDGLENHVFKFLQGIVGYKPRIDITAPHKPNVSVQSEPDKSGKKSLPLTIKSNLVIISLGRVVIDRPGFHNDRYIYPDGFISEHSFTSIKNPNEKTWYRSLILDRGGDTPVFRVELKDDPKIHFEGNVPSKPWMNLIRAIDDVKKRFQLPCKYTAVSGPEYFGLSSPIVNSMMKNLPGASQCIKMPFKVNKYEPSTGRKNSFKNKLTENSDKEDTPSQPPSSPQFDQHDKPLRIQFLSFTFDKLNEDQNAKEALAEFSNSSFKFDRNTINSTLREQLKIPNNIDPIEFVMGKKAK